MLKSQLLTIELSEKRQKINELLALETRSKEQDAELETVTRRAQAIEPELRAALTAEGTAEAAGLADNTPENRELRALSDNASMGRILQATVEHRATSGAEKEIQDHFRLDGNQIPLIMLRGNVEDRNVTPAPGNVGQNQAPIIPGVFPQSCAAFLGVDMPTVGVGEAVFPVLTTNATVHTPAENADADDTTGSFSAEVLSPSRLQAAFFYSREDRARFAGMDEALRMNLSDALADGLDKEIIAGDEGLLHSTNLTNNNVNAVTTFALYSSQFAYGRIDGRYASMTGDIRIVMGSATYGHAGGQYRSNNADYNGIDMLTRVTGGVKVSAHVPGASGSKQNAVIRLGMHQAMTAPVWEGVTLIPDEITLAKKGQIQITAVMLHAVKILRAANFRKQQTQHA